MGLFDFLRPKKNIIVAKSSMDFYDIMFDTLVDIKGTSFFYPNSDDLLFFASEGKIYLNPENKNKEGEIAMYAYMWLRNISTKKELHKHIVSTFYDEKYYSESEKFAFISSVLGKSIQQLQTDPNAVHQIFIRTLAYINIIERFTKSLFLFFEEHEESEFKHYITIVNKDFPKTSKISRTDLTIQDIDRIFLRDMLSGKALK